MADKANILIVDDLPDKLLVFKTILEELDQNLVMVRSGSEALKEVLNREFAVILLDVNMPDIDGLETAGLIRKYKKSAHTPIICLTAYADEMQTAQGYSLGAVDYILSPVIPEVLRSKVKVFVELYQAQVRAREMAEEQARRAHAEEATRRSNFLARASHELGASLDLEEGMQELLELVVPELAEHAVLTVDAEPSKALTRSRGAPCNGAVETFPLRVGERVLGQLSASWRSVQPPKDVSLLEDLTDRAAVALENARLYSSLQREIVRSREAEEELQDANRRKDEFLAMLSHELRNPLAPIRNAVEVIRRIAPSDPKLAMARDVVDRQVTVLARLVEELLDVSRISQGKISLKREVVELSRIIAQSVETARPLIDSRKQELSVRMSPTPVWVSGDDSRLSQIVANLLNNAAKYTPEGGAIELEVASRAGEALITVRDTGAGIEKELLPRVFELFVQGDRSLDRGQGGLGIGLTLVKRLVEMHQGQVEVESDGVGKGSTFRVTLPCIGEVRREEPAPQPLAARREASNVYGRRVLVVDDNSDAAETTAAFLRLEGHEVKTVNDGHQALSSVKVFDPHVIVLDIGLPGLDGYAVARELRSRGDTSHTLLIAMTGYGQREDRARAAEAGFDYHFTKPADPREIQEAIERGRRLMSAPGEAAQA
ncbi:MAG: response regulator [Betaproteobacteria bacterium]